MALALKGPRPPTDRLPLRGAPLRGVPSGHWAGGHRYLERSSAHHSSPWAQSSSMPCGILGIDLLAGAASQKAYLGGRRVRPGSGYSQTRSLASSPCPAHTLARAPEHSAWHSRTGELWLRLLSFLSRPCTRQPSRTLLPSPHARQLDTCRLSEQHHPSWHPDQTERTSKISVGFSCPTPLYTTFRTPLSHPQDIILHRAKPGLSIIVIARLTQGTKQSQPMSRWAGSSPAPHHPSTQPSLLHTLNTSSSVTANVRSSFPDRELISF